MKKKTLLSSIITIALCLCLIAGSTFALFTSEDRVNVAVTAGKVDVTANLIDDSLKTWSLYETEDDARTDGTFVNGGLAQIIDNGETGEAFVQIDLMTPGDVVKFTIDVTNNSNVHVNYRVRMYSNGVAGAVDLTPALVATAYIDDDADAATAAVPYVIGGNAAENATLWQFVEQNKVIGDIDVYIAFPNTDESISPDNADNAYQEAKANLTFIVEAVQSNGKVYDHSIAAAADLQAAFSANGIVTTGGAPVEAEAVWLKGNTTLVDAALEGKAGAPAAIFANGYDDATLELGLGASVAAPADPAATEQYAMLMLWNDTNTVVHKGAVISADGANATAIQYCMGTHSLRLEDSGLIVLTNNARGILIDADTTVNIYVPDAAALAEYKAMIYSNDLIPSTVNWYYLDGTFVETQTIA